jgi:hypothetical protein
MLTINETMTTPTMIETSKRCLDRMPFLKNATVATPLLICLLEITKAWQP